MGIAELYVFGSRAVEVLKRVQGEVVSPSRGSSSDIDIGIRPLPGVHVGVDRVVELAQALEELFDAPRVDVVVLPGAPPFLALEVIRGELLFCEDFDAQAEFELYVLRRAGDLAPFQKLRQELALTRYSDA